MERTNTGTQLKFALGLQCAGLDMDEYDFTARFFTYSDSYVDVRKSDMVRDGSAYVAVVDTSFLGEGEVRVTVTARIPDEDVSGGTRREIATTGTGVVLRRPYGNGMS